MARAPFSIYTRKGTDGKQLYCVRFYDDDGSPIKSTTLWDAKSPTSAARIAETMLRAGVVSSEKNPLALEYLLEFWTKDSDYARSRALRGVVLSEQYMKVNRYLIAAHLKLYLKNKRLLDLSPAWLEKTILTLSRAGLNARSINSTVQAVKVPFANFCRLHRLANALTSVEKLREEPRERGILTADEVGRIIASEDESPRAIAAALLGALCGLRHGEVRGLQWADIDEETGTIHIKNNLVSESEGLKRPKWGSAREVPLAAPVLSALQLCAYVSPYGRAGYVLWNEKRPGAPISRATILTGLRRILRTIGITDEMQEQRNLCFHGLRHTFVSLSRASGIPDFLVQRMAGHKSMVMTDRYSHAEGIIDFAAARASLEAAVKGTTKVVGSAS